MNRSIKKIILVGAMLSVVAGGGGVAIAASMSGPVVHNPSNDGRTITQAVAPPDVAVVNAFPAFGESNASDAASPSVQQQLRDALGGDASSENGAIAHADFSLLPPDKRLGLRTNTAALVGAAVVQIGSGF